MSYHAVKVSDSECDGMLFTTFDVSEEGNIALGILTARLYRAGKIAIYDSSGNFVRLLSFASAGIFYVRWSGDKLLVYFARGDYIGVLSLDGDWIDFQDVPVEMVEATSVQFKGNSHRIVGGVEYFGRNEWRVALPSSYSQLIKLDAGGDEKILFDNTKVKNRNTVLVLMFVLAILALVIVVLPRSIARRLKP